MYLLVKILCYVLNGGVMESIDLIIRSICQDLYENLRHNHSIFSELKSVFYIKKLNKINKKYDYKYIELLRDEIGLLYKNYMVFCKKKEYDNNLRIMKKIYNMYKSLCFHIEQFMTGSDDLTKYGECKDLELYIKNLDMTYGGQTEKYLKKLTKKKLGLQRKQIKDIYEDKSKIISEKKILVKDLLQDKLDRWNGKYKNEKDLEIIYNSEKAEYTVIKIKDGKCIDKKRFKAKINFSDIEHLQKVALKDLKKLNFSIDILEELNLRADLLKYVDPFIILILCKENYLDYAKIYLRLISGNSSVTKRQLPFKIVYKIDKNFSNGKMTPVRNEIMAKIAERGSLNVSYMKIHKNNKNKIKK